VEGFILEEGHTAQRVTHDYGYGLVLFTYDAQGFVEPGLTFFQVKAMETVKEQGTDYVFDLDIRDYNLWIREKMPVILILFDASRKRAWWHHVQGYFREDAARQPRRGAKSGRVRVAKKQVINRRAVAKVRELQRQAVNKPKGVIP
jgi:hypothetical protein